MAWFLTQLRAAAVAVTFLTRLPLPARWSQAPAQSLGLVNEEFSRSLFWFPGVGSLVGGVTALTLTFASVHLGAYVAAVLALGTATLLTGALHWDGLADSVDGWSAGHRDKARILAAMSDGRVGAHGATALCVIILLKVALLSRLTTLAAPTAYKVIACIFAALLARWAVACFVAFLPSAKPGGLAALFATRGARSAAGASSIWVFGFIAVVYALWPAQLAPRNVLLTKFLLAFGLTLLFSGWWGRRWCKLIGGVTGDLSGALIELSEALTLLVWGWA